MKQVEVTSARRVPNKDPVYTLIVKKYHESDVPRKARGGVHYVTWGNIINRSQKYIYISTLIKKIAPALNIPLEQMYAVISATSKKHLANQSTVAAPPVPKLLKRNTQPDAALPQLTYQFLPWLAKSSALRQRLSDDEKLLLLGVALDKFLHNARTYKQNFEFNRENNYKYN